MRTITGLVALVATSALVSSACITRVGTPPPGGGSGGTAGSGGNTGGDASAKDSLWGSGSRLSAVYIDGGDGAAQFLRFHDSDLDVACNFAALDDGSTRCLPAPLLKVHYADASCTTPVIVEGACSEAVPELFSLDVDVQCGILDTVPRRDAYARGATLSPTTIYAMDALGNCSEDTGYDAQTEVVYEATAADAALFAAATLERIEAGGGVGQVVATTEDGAFHVLSAYDVARDEDCDVKAVGDQTLCLSTNLAYGQDLSNSATCDENDVARGGLDEDCGEPQAIIKTTPGQDSCDAPTVTLHAVGDEVAAADVYTDATGTCEAVADTTSRYYAIGGEAMEGVVPALAEATVGTGRLTTTRWTSDDGAPVGQAMFTFEDTERGESCNFAVTADGNKCLPEFHALLTGATHFADDQCTQPLVGFASNACEIPSFVAFYTPQVGACPSQGIESLHPVGALHTGMVYQDVAGTCTLGTFEGIDLYAIDAAMSFTDFADLAEVTEPAPEE